MNVLLSFTQKLTDTIFPPSPEALLVRHASTSALAAAAVPRIHADTTTFLSFHDPLVRAALHEAKFHGNTRAIQLLGHACEDFFSAHTDSVIVPIPLSRRRLRERGFNQTTEILKVALHDFEKAHENVLARIRHTKPQTELAREDRLANLENAFRVVHPKLVEGASIVLVDDVMTTGATLKAAKSALLQHNPASVTCVALAH